MTCLLVLLLMITLVGACASPPEQLTDQQHTAIKATIAQLTTAARTGVSALDPQQVFRDLFPTDEAVLINQGGYHVTYDSVLTATSRAFRFVTSQTFILEEQQTYVLSPSSAVVSESGRFEAVFINKAAVVGRYGLTLVFAKVVPDWKMIHCHQSSLPSG